MVGHCNVMAIVMEERKIIIIENNMANGEILLVDKFGGCMIGICGSVSVFSSISISFNSFLYSLIPLMSVCINLEKSFVLSTKISFLLEFNKVCLLSSFKVLVLN